MQALAIELPFPKKNVASLLGTTPESLSRTGTAKSPETHIAADAAKCKEVHWITLDYSEVHQSTVKYTEIH